MRNVQGFTATAKRLTDGYVSRRPKGTRVEAECPRCGTDAVPVSVLSEPATFRGGMTETPDNSDASVAGDCGHCGAGNFTRDERTMIIDHAWELFRGLAD